MDAGFFTTTPSGPSSRTTSHEDPSGSQRVEDLRDDGLGRLVAREARGEAVTAAALAFRDLAHVDRAERAQAHAPGEVGTLFQHARDLRLAGAAEHVDESLDLVEG